MSAGLDPLTRVHVARADGDGFAAYTRRRGARIELLPVGDSLPDLDTGEQLSLCEGEDGTRVQLAIVTTVGFGQAAVLQPVAGPRDQTDPGSSGGSRAAAARDEQRRSHQRARTRSLVMQLEEVVDLVGVSRDDEQAASGTGPARRIAAAVLDISAGGARIEHTGDVLAVGTLWHVRTTLVYDDGSELPVEQIAEVRWALDPSRAVAAAPDGATAGPEQAVAGLRFMGIRPGLQESLDRWVAEQHAG